MPNIHPSFPLDLSALRKERGPFQDLAFNDTNVGGAESFPNVPIRSRPQRNISVVCKRTVERSLQSSSSSSTPPSGLSIAKNAPNIPEGEENGIVWGEHDSDESVSCLSRSTPTPLPGAMQSPLFQETATPSPPSTAYHNDSGPLRLETSPPLILTARSLDSQRLFRSPAAKTDFSPLFLKRCVSALDGVSEGTNTNAKDEKPVVMDAFSVKNLDIKSPEVRPEASTTALKIAVLVLALICVALLIRIYLDLKLASYISIPEPDLNPVILESIEEQILTPVIEELPLAPESVPQTTEMVFLQQEVTVSRISSFLQTLRLLRFKFINHIRRFFLFILSRIVQGEGET